jgi:hypothetical protein
MSMQVLLVTITLLAAEPGPAAQVQGTAPPFLRLLYLQGQGAETCPRSEAF